MKREIIPTIFAYNKRGFKRRFAEDINLSKNLQIDFMDGKFVESKSTKISQVPNLKRYKNNFEAHLMTINPARKFKELKKKGFKKIIFHIETVIDREDETINKVKSLGLKCFVALKPETSSRRIFPYVDKIDGVLLMGIHPGKEHQKFIAHVYSRVRDLRKKFPNLVIQIDGGVNLETARKLKKVGATILNTGSFVSCAHDPKKALKELEKVFC